MQSSTSSSVECRDEAKCNREFKFKTTVNTNESDDQQLVCAQTDNMPSDSSNRLKLSFDINKYPQQPNAFSSPCVDSSNRSNIECNNSASKSVKAELSEEAKMLMGKLNIALAGSRRGVAD